MTLILNAHSNRDTHLIVQEMKREIHEDITTGLIPPTVGSFSELHDYICLLYTSPSPRDS